MKGKADWFGRASAGPSDWLWLVCRWVRRADSVHLHLGLFQALPRPQAAPLSVGGGLLTWMRVFMVVLQEFQLLKTGLKKKTKAGRP